MSLKINEVMETPVPKPRARYKLGLRRQSQDRDSAWYDSEFPLPLYGTEEGSDEPLPASSTSTDVPVENPGGSSTTLPPDKPPYSSAVSEALVSCPPSPPHSPVGLIEQQPALVVSDSSNDEETPMTPDSPKSDNEATKMEAQGTAPFQNGNGVVPDGSVNSRFVFGGTSNSILKSTEKQAKAQLEKQKTPRVATIRVSRKRQSPAGAQAADARLTGSVVCRSSWLDVWKGRKHHVLWATLDGQFLSLWKKRTDKFTEYIFHVASISNVRKQDSGRFSIHFGKKHFEFMAHSQAVQEGWVTSLQATRGTEAPPSPDHHSALTMKDPRTKVYAAITGHNLWIYSKKEDFTLGIGMTCVSMNVASVKQTGRHGFSLITPYKTFNFSADSSRELGVWLNCLNQGILSALSCSEVAHRLWASPWNKVCGDCGSPSPEWASINLLLVICEDCAGQHRALGANKSKVRSLKLDSKVWTEPLIELFVTYGNKAANDVWGYNIPAAEQILPDSTASEREAFIRAKYIKGLFRRAHPLASNRDLLEKRLCQVVCGSDVVETLSLICSGARVLCMTGERPITLAEQAGQALQVELLRHNEYLEAPTFDQPVSSKDNPGLEELHGKLEDERFLFSQENDSAACDVLDLCEVIAIHERSEGSTYEFDVLTLTDKLICNANTQDVLLTHLLHILKVVLPGNIEDTELTGLFAASRVSIWEASGLQHTEAWVTLRAGEMLIFPTHPQGPKEKLALSTQHRYLLNSSENTVEMAVAERTLCLRFDKQSSGASWFASLQRAAASTRRDSQGATGVLAAATVTMGPSLVTASWNAVPPGVQRCISHITEHGLKVEGLYRRCGIATKTNLLVEMLSSRPAAAQLETEEQGVLNAASALKQLLRRQIAIIPHTYKEQWVQAAAGAHEGLRLQSYCHLVRQLPLESKATLEVLCGHLYQVQLHSKENLMTAQNLALVFVPTLFQELAMNTDMVRLTRELIIHHALIFQKSMEVPVEEEQEKQDQWDGGTDEMITVF